MHGRARWRRRAIRTKRFSRCNAGWKKAARRFRWYWREPRFVEALCALFAATPAALSAHLIRFPARTWPLLQAVLVHQINGGEWRQRIDERLLAAKSYAGQSPLELRRARTECMLQIAALDLLGLTQMPDTARALSDLADACVDAALQIAVGHLETRLEA